ncbi:hypothetical protein KSB_88210 [Ktedonobacter robiniae]|uniref:Luciferase-like domain-containing protein n=1 Tax=Ktedonobacter robiniae TaxID=2778365 RepID=A0ABQ3V5X9_9CHLR|nr:hypothetical protein KSB_88210 [Ktedonobacter robiniae]
MAHFCTNPCTIPTMDIISNGRLDFGIGVGWNEREHSSYGIPPRRFFTLQFSAWL